MFGDRGGGRFEQRERQGGVGPAGGGEHGAEAAVGVADQVRAVAEQRGDVVGIGQEVLAHGAGAAPVAASVEHPQAEPAFGERPLGVPLFDADRQAAVDQDHGRSPAPGLDEQPVDGGVVFRSTRSVPLVGISPPDSREIRAHVVNVPS